MWYMLEGYHEKIDWLNRQGIPAMTAEISSPVHTVGIAFPEDRKNEVFSLLGITGISFNEQRTDQANVRLLSPGGFDAEQKVYMENRESSLRYRRILTELSERLRIGMKCFIPHGENRHPEGVEGDLHIYIWSTPGYSDKYKLDRAHGVRLDSDGPGDALYPSGEGTVITDDQGHQLAEVLPWNIYILFDITHRDNYQDLFRQILEQSLPVALPGSWSEQLSAMHEADAARRLADEEAKRKEFMSQKERFRQMYIQACAGRIHSVTDEKRKQVTQAERDIERLTQQLIELSRHTEIVRAELNGLANSNDGLNSRFGKEFDQLFENDKINRVEVDETKIEVYTNDMIINHRDYEYNFGPFMIQILLNGQLRIFALKHGTRETHEIVHPHVQQGSVGCLGNISSEVAKLIARQEYVVLVNLIIDFLQSYDSGNPYRPIEVWRDGLI